MKQFFLFSSFVVALTLFSCNDKVGEVLDDKDEHSVTIDSVFTYDMYFDSEITPYDGTTRAASADYWEDGDVVYFHFRGTNDLFGQAVYISTSKKWRITCDQEIVEAFDDSCSVWFGKGVNFLEKRSVFDSYLNVYSYFTEVYSTVSGKYTFNNNGIYVSAIMQPYSWRLRFKGTVGTEIQVSPSHWVTIINGVLLNYERGFFYSGTSNCNLIVGSNGYTDYIAARDNLFGGSPGTDIIITDMSTGMSFSRNFDIGTLQLGESGCFTIPTSTDLHGWTKITPTINGHEYVDLGLPSGTKWATCNIGATKPEEYGGYYAWGETEEKDYYDWSTYKHCDGSEKTCHYIGDDIAGTEHDVVHVKWGGSWRMPSEDHIKELVDNCTRTWTTQNGVDGILVIGPNGANIFLPAAGSLWDFGPSEEGKRGKYMSSSLNLNFENNAYDLNFNSSYWDWDFDYRYLGLSVRAVCP